MNLKKICSYLAMLAFSVFMLTACGDDEEDPPLTPENPTPKPVTELYAGSTSETSIRVEWTHSTSVDSTWFGNYRMIVEDMTTSKLDSTVIVKGQSYYDRTNAVNGTTYKFTIEAVSDSGKVSTPASISWATSKFFEKNDNSADIKVYGSKSQFGSGLELYGDGNAPTIHKVANGSKWNLGLYTTGGVIKFGSASALGYTTVTNPADAEITAIQSSIDTNKLESTLLNGDLTGFTFSKQALDLTSAPATSKEHGITFFVKVGNNYARVIVLKKNGSYLQDAGSNDEYVQVLVSYQTKSGVPYAKIFAGK